MPETIKAPETPEPAKGQEPVPYEWVARVSIALFATPAHRPQPKEIPSDESLYTRLTKWLDDDPRVKVFAPIAVEDNVLEPTSFSMAGRPFDKLKAETKDVPPPHNHVHVLRFKRPIVFKVNFPKRFQPQERGDSAIPAEDYYVAWDGVALIVMWKAASPKSDDGFFGGFSALDLLRDALKATDGGRLVVEPCGPYCEYPFAHRDLVITQTDDSTDVTFSDRTKRSVAVTVPRQKDPLDILRQVGSRMSRTTRIFAQMRSFGASTTDNYRDARSELTELLRLQYELARTSAIPLHRSIRARWGDRGKPQQMSLLTAGLWLRLANVESNRRNWQDARSSFESEGRWGEDLVFKIEYDENVQSVESMQTDYLRASVDGMTLRADSRSVTAATVAGAVAGGAVGGLIALVAALASSGAA